MADSRIIKSLGVDIGQKQDPPAMVLTERQAGKNHVLVTQVAQLPLGMPYPKLVADIELVAGEADIVVLDGTGVGAPIVDFCRDKIPNSWAAIATAGKNIIINADYHTVHIPKPMLVETVVRMIEHDDIKVEPKGDYEKLLGELRDLQRTQKAMTVRYGARSGKHDDLVMALANSLLGFGLDARARAAA